MERFFESPKLESLEQEKLTQEKTPEKGLENPVEQGKSFLARTKDTLKEGIKMFFSVPEDNKFMNILAKADGALLMGLSTKFIMDHRFDEIIASGDHNKIYLGLAGIGILGAGAISAALLEQYSQKQRREHEKIER